MPQISYPVYAVHHSTANDDVIGPVLAGLHEIAIAPEGLRGLRDQSSL
jgi:hypothetical protein